MVFDQEFASALTCTKRDGNILSMSMRSFWDSGEYSPLIKTNPIRTSDAHICITTHITMEELKVVLPDMQVVNGFANRFLWICARRTKLVPLPSPMPTEEIRQIQNKLWRLVEQAQKIELVSMSAKAQVRWKEMYPIISREHKGVAGSILNRGEAQTLRLALIYCLFDGKQQIDEHHLDAALAFWSYAEASVLYIFGGRAANPLEEKIVQALKQGSLSATGLSNALGRNVSKNVLDAALQGLLDAQQISITQIDGTTKKTTIISLNV